MRFVLIRKSEGRTTGPLKARTRRGRTFAGVALGCMLMVYLTGGTPPARANNGAPRLLLQVSPDVIVFVQNGPPGPVQAVVPPGMAGRSADLRVLSDFRPGGWSVIAEGTSLYDLRGRQIRPDRMFIGSPATRSFPDAGAGPGYRPLGASVAVAAGSAGDYTVPLNFRLVTSWTDTPGIYAGLIRFTAIVNP